MARGADCVARALAPAFGPLPPTVTFRAAGPGRGPAAHGVTAHVADCGRARPSWANRHSESSGGGSVKEPPAGRAAAAARGERLSWQVEQPG